MTRPAEIIDCHIHPALDEATAFGWFQACGTFADQVKALRRAGITRACGAPVQRIDGTSFAPVRRLNDLALRLRDRFPAFYIPGIQVHPHFPDESCREVERCCGGEGVRWVGELVGYMMGFADEFATPGALAIVRAAARHGAVVNIHCHDQKVIAALCAAAPEAKLVVAHPGSGKAEILERGALLAAHPNLHLDLSGSGIDRYGVVRRLIDLAGREKVLFGTDYPINNPAVYTHGVRFESLTATERAAVFAGNFRRLTGLPAPQSVVRTIRKPR